SQRELLNVLILAGGVNKLPRDVEFKGLASSPIVAAPLIQKHVAILIDLATIGALVAVEGQHQLDAVRRRKRRALVPLCLDQLKESLLGSAWLHDDLPRRGSRI